MPTQTENTKPYNHENQTASQSVKASPTPVPKTCRCPASPCRRRPGRRSPGRPAGRGRGGVFVIAMENHNFTQPNPASSPAANSRQPGLTRRFLNSLITPGNPNAARVSYALNYYNTGNGVHPSEPNYVWAEAGSDFGVHTDADPKNPPAATRSMTTASIWSPSWTPPASPGRTTRRTSSSAPAPTNSASGSNTTVINAFYGTTQYNYAVKHNPMAFFSDSAVKNVYPLSQLFLDLGSHTTGSYNWITPDQFNDAHSALNGGFTYQGTNYTGDQASIAQGDNFLATVIPEIMASKAYRENGAIIIWWDESEGGDTTNFSIPEIIISPLAKGNAYASSVAMSHSSDIKTMAEIFRLPAINNPIPLSETNIFGRYNNVATANDLADLFVPGAIPAATAVTVTSGHIQQGRQSDRASQVVEIKNTGTTPVPAPVFLVLDSLSPNATLVNSGGLMTTMLTPLGSPLCQRQPRRRW